MSDDRVLDSFAVLAWLHREASAGQVRALFEAADAGRLTLSLSSINAGEVFYRLSRARQSLTAEAFWRAVIGGDSPIALVPATDIRIEQAARLKAAHIISYADAFAVALARELGVPLVTGDPEIRRLADMGVVDLDWLTP
jgi:predicted nucleic acid-binding protein